MNGILSEQLWADGPILYSKTSDDNSNIYKLTYNTYFTHVTN